MGDARPIDGENPYEKLGVDRTKPRSELIPEAKKIKQKKELEVKQAHDKGDEVYNRLNEEAMAMREAAEQLEQNHPEDGHPEPKDLSIELLTDNPSVKESVEFRVTAGDGGESGISVDTNRSQAGTTDSNGKVSFMFQSTGPVKVTASGGMQYEPDSITVSISKKTVSLQILDAPDKLEAREDGQIRVVDQNDNPVESVPLMDGSDQVARTDGSGVGTVSFQKTGPKTIEATAADSSDITYESDSTKINVVEETIPLNLQVPRSGLETNTETAFKVVDDNGDGIAGATVKAEDGPEGTTGSDGKAELSFREPGARKIVATKSTEQDSVRYETETVTLEVGKGEGALEVGETEGQFTEGNDVRLQIVDESGVSITGAEVSTNQGHSATTNQDGWVEISLKSGSTLEVEATKESERLDYQPLNTTFTVSEYQPKISLEGLPQIGSTNERVRVRVVDEDGNGIGGVKIHSSQQRSKVWKTDGRGEATVELMGETGAEMFTADKPAATFENVAEDQVLVQ